MPDECGVALDVDVGRAHVPGHASVFYNERMRLNRDLAVLCAAAAWPFVPEKTASAGTAGSSAGAAASADHDGMDGDGDGSALATVDADASQPQPQPQPQPPSQPPKTLYALDACCASGVLGMRIKRTLPLMSVTLNDVEDEVCERARRVSKQNGVVCDVVCATAEVTLASRAWHFVHIDPFGSPGRFLDSAFVQAPPGGVVVVTGTDVSALFGITPNVALRWYGGLSARLDCKREIGARLVAAATIAAAARHGRSVRVLYATSLDHFVQVAFGVMRGSQRADAALSSVRPAWHHLQTGQLAFGDFPDCLPLAPDTWAAFAAQYSAKAQGMFSTAVMDGWFERLGPMYSGPLFDKDFLAAMLRVAAATPDAEASRVVARVELAEHAATMRHLQQMHAEASSVAASSPFFYCLPKLGYAMPSYAKLMAALDVRGFPSARTHFNASALRTAAPLHVIKECLAQLTQEARQQQEAAAAAKRAHTAAAAGSDAAAAPKRVAADAASPS